MPTIREKLLSVQAQLKAPKNQKNSFWGYKYRSCEDIMEALKPLLAKEKLTLTMCDTIELIWDRFYVKATAELRDAEDNNDIVIRTTAYAREAEDKKGMDVSQITWASSSYARKYCLNAMFLIDDTKDADTMDNTAKAPSTNIKTLDDAKNAISKCNSTIELAMLAKDLAELKSSGALTSEQYEEVKASYNERTKQLK